MWRKPTGAPRATGGAGQCRATPRGAEPRRALRRSESTRDTPSWLLARWRKTYGNETARAIAIANGHEPALDLTVKEDAASWAERLHGRVLPTGSVRTLAQGAIALLPGFNEGAWRVQDAAASLPARLLGEVRGLSVADLCAAPGGKTAQLALAGARVTAVDRSPARLNRLRDNLERLALHAVCVTADVLEWDSGPFDAVLLDARRARRPAPFRRHPDVPWLKDEADIATLAALQPKLIDRALALLKPAAWWSIASVR